MVFLFWESEATFTIPEAMIVPRGRSGFEDALRKRFHRRSRKARMVKGRI